MATAGMPSSLTRETNLFILDNPSRSEYSVWTWRWTKFEDILNLCVVRGSTPVSGKGSLIILHQVCKRFTCPFQDISRDFFDSSQTTRYFRLLRHNRYTLFS